MIYLIGYSGRTIDDLKRIVGEFSILIDIRFSAKSRLPGFSAKSLEREFPNQYLHLWEWGNESYSGESIKIYKPNEGLTIVLDMLTKLDSGGWRGDLFLMCVCKDGHKCHRRQVAELLREHGYEVKEYGED